MSRIFNDEPVFEDYLDHFGLVQEVGRMVLDCQPPYVIGVGGAWGSGKTSFLHKLRVHLGGEIEDAELERLQKSLGRKRVTAAKKDIDRCHLVWFNPWQHQFEESPLVALLQEIRNDRSIPRMLWDDTKKFASLSRHAAFDTLLGYARTLKLPAPDAKGIRQRSRQMDTESFALPLTSQRFREYFEAAIREVIGQKKRLVIFIDDLDRCEGQVAYRLLESLKLYLNARNCVYVLGMDQAHLEESIAGVISKGDDFRSRLRARSYLNKIFQNTFLLPVPEDMRSYVELLVDPHQDSDFKTLMSSRYGLEEQEWPNQLVDTLDANLPRNPRRVKAFVSTWKLYTRLLAQRRPDVQLNWRLSVILNYLGQFEEPLFRKIERAPGFYSHRLLSFCRTAQDPHPLFEGLELPEGTVKVAQETTGGLDSSAESTGGFATGTPSRAPQAKDYPEEKHWQMRSFRISQLIRELKSIDPEQIRLHLLGAWIEGEARD